MIQPIGPFDPARENILSSTIEYMGHYFNLPTRREPTLPLDVVAAKARRVHPKWGDKQLHTQWILRELLEPKLPADAAAMTAFTASDLYPEDGWNYVFGEADLKARVGVWSVYRHGDPSKSKDALLLALRRALKVAVHETGHMFSLEHCTAYRCVQAGVNHLDEEDHAPLWLCVECVTKIVWATESEHESHYQKLLGFCRNAGIEDEVHFVVRFSSPLMTLCFLDISFWWMWQIRERHAFWKVDFSHRIARTKGIPRFPRISIRLRYCRLPRIMAPLHPT